MILYRLISVFLLAALPGTRTEANPPLPELASGDVIFPTSCSASAQQRIVSGVSLLHSFQYQESESAFAEAAVQDPDCAMAYWGKAMAITRFLWKPPGAQELESGLDDVKQAEKRIAPTDRERRYISAMDAFYQDDVRLPYGRRVEAFSSVMAKLTERYPEDVDAAAFYALSLITVAHLEQHGSGEDFANRSKALAVLIPRFRQYPDHPGLAHYIIHAADSPEFAAQGLEAAERYRQIASGSAHALHMPSHVFVWLGMWKEAIACNLASWEAARKATLLEHGSADYSLHAIDFLDYAYLQSGQASKAEALVPEIAGVPGADEKQAELYRSLLGARNALELHDWKMATSLANPSPHMRLRGFVYFVRTLGAARSGNAVDARKQLQNLISLKDTFLWNQIQFDEAEAWVDHAEGKDEAALSLLTSAAEEERPAGTESLDVPAREMLGDLLLEIGRPQQALNEYRVVLKTHQSRYNALYGAARAARAAGLKAETAQYSRSLIASIAADADRPGLLEFKNMMLGTN